MVIDIGPALLKAKETVNEGAGDGFCCFSLSDPRGIRMIWVILESKSIVYTKIYIGETCDNLTFTNTCVYTSFCSHDFWVLWITLGLGCVVLTQFNAKCHRVEPSGSEVSSSQRKARSFCSSFSCSKRPGLAFESFPYLFFWGAKWQSFVRKRGFSSLRFLGYSIRRGRTARSTHHQPPVSATSWCLWT